MPTLKKKPSGKATITMYAQERRQIEGSIVTYRFTEVNGDEEKKKLAKAAADSAEAFLKSFSPKETQGELIPDDKKGAAK